MTDGLDVLGVVNAEPDFGCEEAVAGVDVYAVDVDIELLRQDARYLMQDAYAVEADDVQGGGEGECAVSVPGGGQNPVPSGCLESFRNVALALVDDDLAVLVDVSEHIIPGDGVALVAQGVSADGLFAEDEGLLLVDLECLRTFPPGGFLVLLCGGGVLVPMPLEDGQVLAPLLFLVNLFVEGAQVGFSQCDGLRAYHGKQFLAAAQGMEAAQFGDVDACGFFLVFLQEIAQDVFADLLFLALHFAEDGYDFAFRFSRCDEVYPAFFDFLVLRCEYLDLVSALEDMADADEFVVHLGSDAMGAEEGVHAEGEVEDCAACRHRLELAFGCHDENLVGKQVELDGVEEVDGIRLRVVQDFLDLVEPSVQFVLAFLRGLVALLVFPVGGKAVLGDVVHAAAAYLHLNPFARLAHECGVEGLVAVGLLVVHPVAQAVGMGLVYGAGDVVDFEAFVRFVHAFRHFEYDADGQDVVDLLEGDMLRLHLRPDAVGFLDARLYFVLDACLVELLPDGGRELVEDACQVLADALQLVLDRLVFLGVLVAETEFLELLLHFVQAESVCQGSVDVERLARNLVLFAGQLAAQGAHVMQSVGNLNQDDSDVFAHGEQQLLEALRLDRCLVAEDAARNLGQSVYDLRYLRAEDVGDVLDRIVRILDYIVQERRADACAAQADVLAGNLCHGNGVHDVWLARKSTDTLVRFLCEVEGLVDDFGVLAMVRCQIGVYQMLIGFGNHPFIFHFTKVNVFHSPV